MSGALTALFLVLLSALRAADMRTEPVRAPGTILGVPTLLGSQSLSSRLDSISLQPGPGAIVPNSLAIHALQPLQITPAVHTVAITPPTAIDTVTGAKRKSSATPTRHPGRTALQQLAQDLPDEKPASGDLTGQKNYADRDFASRLGEQNDGAEPAAAVPATDATADNEKKESPEQIWKRLEENGDEDTYGSGLPATKPLPPSHDSDSSLPNLDAAVEMSVSHSYPGRTGTDPEAEIVKMIDDYIVFPGMPDSDKHLVLKFFEIGEPAESPSPVVQAIARLVKAGIRTTIITDLNQSLTGVFPKNETHSTDFGHASYKDTNAGRALRHLRENLGFRLRYNSGKFTVLSGEPLFNPRSKGERPLMHDKGVFALGPADRAYGLAWNGTANMNSPEAHSPGPLPDYGGRYNRMILSKDVAANQADWNHVMAEISTFDRRRFAMSLPAELDVPQRINYPSGEFREIAFSNGRQNLNVRLTDMFERATQALFEAKARKDADPAADIRDIRPDFEIEEVIFSHYVLTYTPEVEAFRKYLDALSAFYPDDFQERIKIFGIFDQQFISPDAWGEAAALEGFLVQRPQGKSIFPFRSEFRPLMKLFGYLRLISGVSQIDPDSDAVPIKMHLWHDKTTMMKVKERDPRTGEIRPWTYAWTRSFNNSGHYQSLESQDMYRMLPDSRLAKEFEDSIKEAVKAKPEYAVNLDQAIVASWLAHFTEHTIYDEGLLGYAEKTVAALVVNNYALVESLLTQIVALPTKHIQAATGAEVKTRIAQFLTFLRWYEQEAARDPNLNKMTYRKAVNIGVGLAAENLWGLRNALDVLFYHPQYSYEERLVLMRKAWKEGLAMAAPFPEPKGRLGPASLN